jgi:hypothetical protein
LTTKEADVRATLVGLTLFVVGTVCFAQGGNSTGGEATPVPVSPADLKWTDLDPAGAPGVKVATVWGDLSKGAFGAFLKLPAGFAAPLHTHTHDFKLVIVSGTFLQAPQGKPEFRLGPGSYLMQPGGSYQHTTGCDQASECLFFVESEGAFDLHPVPEPTP